MSCNETEEELKRRKGLYNIKAFPQIIGNEASGTIVALPTDPAVLNDERFKTRRYKVGQRVAVVRVQYLQFCIY